MVFFLPPAEPFAGEYNLRGSVALETRHFINSPLFAGQNENYDFSGVINPDLSCKLDGGDRFTFIPFYREDNVDSTRTHFDIRELSYVAPRDGWELRLGVRKEFWGATEAIHLVDVINQTDLMEDPGAREKLGQPMANLSVERDWGTVDFFVLPYSRQRTFPGKHGRVRVPLVIDNNQAEYESGAKERHIDYAVRYFHTIGALDIGVSQFVGTDREPLFRVGTKGDDLVLVPFYQQMNQTGVDATYVAGNWLWKFEGIHKGMQHDDYYAWAGGFEYTFAGVAGTGMDLGLVSEWLYDDRGPRFAIFDNDVAYGFRWGLNDYNNTSVLAVVYQNIETTRRFLGVEASTRFGIHWKVTLEYHGFLDQPAEDILHAIRDDDFLKLRLAYHF